MVSIKDNYLSNDKLDPIEFVYDNMIRCDSYGYNIGDQETITFKDNEYIVVVVSRNKNSVIVEVLEEI